jgi:hypothetical protein
VDRPAVQILRPITRRQLQIQRLTIRPARQTRLLTTRRQLPTQRLIILPARQTRLLTTRRPTQRLIMKKIGCLAGMPDAEVMLFTIRRLIIVRPILAQIWVTSADPGATAVTAQCIAGLAELIKHVRADIAFQPASPQPVRL